MIPRRPPVYTGRFTSVERPHPLSMPAILTSSVTRDIEPVGPQPPPAPATITVQVDDVAPTPAPSIAVPADPPPPSPLPIISVDYVQPVPVPAPSITVPADKTIGPSIDGDPDIVDPVIEGCPTGPYLAILLAPQSLRLESSPLSAARGSLSKRLTAADVTVPAGCPRLATAYDIKNHTTNRHTCDFRLPLRQQLELLVRAMPKIPWWPWFLKSPRILETMVLVNSGGIWNAVAPAEDYRAFKGTTSSRLGCSFGLFQLNEFYAGPLVNQKVPLLGSEAAKLVTSPSPTRTLLQLGRYNEDPGSFRWALALCHRPEAILWGLLFAAYYARALSVSVDLPTGRLRATDASADYKLAASIAAALCPSNPGAAWLRAIWVAGTPDGAAKLLKSKDVRITAYTNNMR